MHKMVMMNKKKVLKDDFTRRLYEETLSRVHLTDEEVLNVSVHMVDRYDCDLYYYQIVLYLEGHEIISRRMGYPKESVYVGFSK